MHKKDEVVNRLKRAGLSDEFITAAFRPEVLSSDHTDMGTGHSDFPKHQDLHLDVPFKFDSRADVASLAASVELREALNEWVRVMNERVIQLERRIESLQRK